MNVVHLHAAATLFMTGLIWFVQVVHYPLMVAVGDDGFVRYEHGHARRTGWVVGPVMIVEAITATWLALAPPPGIAPGAAWGAWGLLGMIWLSTAALQAPAHRALHAGFDRQIHRRLVRTNWIRTAGWSVRAVLALSFLAPVTAVAQSDSTDEVTAVAEVDLERYAGLWYEVARLPNRFQRSCVGNVTATYTLRDDGRIDVDNRCLEADGEVNRARGVARIANPPRNSKLEVSFFKILFWRPVWGDYWVIGLDPEYRWAIVGVPKRDYGWILSRRPDLDVEDRSRIDAILREQGYDPADFGPTASTPTAGN